MSQLFFDRALDFVGLAFGFIFGTFLHDLYLPSWHPPWYEILYTHRHFQGQSRSDAYDIPLASVDDTFAPLGL
jgi:hypothetical protein